MKNYLLTTTITVTRFVTADSKKMAIANTQDISLNVESESKIFVENEVFKIKGGL